VNEPAARNEAISDLANLAGTDVRPRTPTLSPEYRGEGVNAAARNEAISDLANLVGIDVPPLTPTLSPEYEGEGEGENAAARNEAITDDHAAQSSGDAPNIPAQNEPISIPEAAKRDPSAKPVLQKSGSTTAGRPPEWRPLNPRLTIYKIMQNKYLNVVKTDPNNPCS
jgi:hypothetical protein